jgi:hypothetical protein
VDVKRLLFVPDLQSMTPKRRLRHDLLYALAVLPFAMLLGLLLDDELTGYPLTFGGTWAALGTVMAVGRYVMSRDRR